MVLISINCLKKIQVIEEKLRLKAFKLYEAPILSDFFHFQTPTHHHDSYYSTFNRIMINSVL